jgi:replicative DNA helicase
LIDPRPLPTNVETEFLVPSDGVRELPKNVEAEQLILGAVLLNPEEAMQNTASILQPADFYLRRHRIIHRVQLELYTRGDPVDIISVANRLDELGDTERAGGRLYLNELLTRAATATSLEYYSGIVKQKASLRALIEVGGQISELGYEDDKPAEGQVDRAMEILMSVAPTEGGESDLLVDAIESWAEEVRAVQRGEGLTTGYPTLDKYLRSAAGQVIVLAGLSGLGKSSLGLNMIWHQACKNIPAAIISLEMTREQVAERLLQIEGNCSSDDLAFNPTLAKGFISKLIARPIRIAAMGDRSIGAIIRQMRLYHNQGFRSFFVDYLQLISCPSDRRDREIGESLRMLLEFSKRYNDCVITASQVGSQVIVNGKVGAPGLTDMSEARVAIASHSDMLLGLSRSAYTTGNQGAYDLTVEILKNRKKGGIGTRLSFLFDPKKQRIEEGIGRAHAI